MAWNVTITNEGLPLIAAVIMNQGTLTFTELRLSDTDYRGQEATLTEGTFGGVYLTTSATASIIDSTTIRVKGNFNGAGLTEAHEVCSLGIIATDGNDTVLLAVCTDTTPGTIEPGVGGRVSTLSFNVNLSVSSTDNITVVGTTAGVLYDIDVVDTLISTATDKPLSANMGRVLKGNIDDNFSGQSNRNFVDNPFFTINQRGATTVTSGYGADRWKFVGGTEAVFSSTGVTLNSVLISQFFEKQLPNGVFTASALFNDGTIRKGTATKSNDTSPVRLIDDADFKLTYEPSLLRFDINTAGMSSGLTVRAVKLEPGSVSTLHLDVAPDPTTELLKCQRYLAPAGWCTVNKYDTNAYFGIVKLPVPMYGTPTIATPTLSNCLWLPGTGYFTPDTGVGYFRDITNTSIGFIFTGTNLTADMYVFDSSIFVSSEL